MATDKSPPSSPTGPAANPASDAAGNATKAQEEFKRYKARVDAAPPMAGPMYMVPIGLAPNSQAVPGWAVPPSVATLPQAPGSGGFYLPMPQAGMGGEGSLLAQLGSTIRLGVDVINAALAGSARMLNGMSGMAYSYGGAPGWDHACCGSCCECPECCGQDCCGCCNECCSPSVGRCC